MFSGVFTHWPQVPRGPWVNERGRSVVPKGLSVCLSVRPSPILHSPAICLGDRGTKMTHGLKHELSSSLPQTVSGGTTGLTNIPKNIHITPAHRDTRDTWRAIRPRRPKCLPKIHHRPAASHDKLSLCNYERKQNERETLLKTWITQKNGMFVCQHS